ncbi:MULTISPECIES: hypothetical protein [Pseudoalteromonas]|uniref:hypothetical protein n=1 Tax=Pseudoalteromonas TaxID=53246 RepID=UPI000C32E283|nr:MULTISPECIES: hypothetical protein [Pseudoalteromonas]PKG62757.1 hypothetical protein CXF75_18130 [Pseudoalteromonas arctica]PKG70493.1 hypothetical protein CXF64_10970 [Pseudoalteromonas sp. GutCa3]
MMNRALFTLLFTFSGALNASVQLDFKWLPLKKITYEVSIPHPFGETILEFYPTTDSDRRIRELRISTAKHGWFTPNIETLRKETSVQVKDIEFIIKDAALNEDGSAKYFEFNIYYGAPNKVNCNGRTEYVPNSKLLKVFADGEVSITEDRSYFELCEELKKYNKSLKQDK